MSTSNPFEPPRTTDLDAVPGGPAAKGALALSEESLQELSATAPWARWLARMTSLSIAVGIVGLVADLTGSESVTAKAANVVGVAISTVIATLALVVLRRYAAASEALRAGTRSAAGDVIDAQASYFRLQGILIVVALGLLVGLFGIGILLGSMR
jgi:hypothetical protein